MTKLITGLVALLIIIACQKDEIQTDNPLHETITGWRSGEPLPQLFIGSRTIHFPDGKQVVIGDSFEIAKIKNTSANMVNPVTGVYYKASQYRVVSNIEYLPKICYVQDTIPLLRIPKTKEYVEITRTKEFVNYYDYRYLKPKIRYKYIVKDNNTYSEKMLECWHHPNSNIFFLDHKN